MATPNGLIVGVRDVKLEIRICFESFFKDSNELRPTPKGISFSRASAKDNIMLEAPFTEEKVRVAVGYCSGDKSPGTDGYTLEIFKKNLRLLKGDVMQFIGDFHEKAILIKACTSSFITLILKDPNPQELKQYRPIF